jgi:Zn-dependent peptidase ImmA (M78 family)
MALPKKISFMSQTYTVIEDDIVETKREGSFATIDFIDRTIYIFKDMQEDAKEEALLHELVHVVEHHMNIPLEEEYVAQLSMGIYHLLKQNKLFNG